MSARRSLSQRNMLKSVSTKPGAAQTPISSQASNRSERLPRSGSRITKKSGLIRPTGSCHPFRTGNTPNQQKCPPLDCLLDGGDYTLASSFNRNDISSSCIDILPLLGVTFWLLPTLLLGIRYSPDCKTYHSLDEVSLRVCGISSRYRQDQRGRMRTATFRLDTIF